MCAVKGFWDFSVETYQLNDVAEACLALQDQSGADVNMLLYCCWVAKVSGKFDDELYQTAMQFSEEWASHVVRPLRGVRQWMKPNDHSDMPALSGPHTRLRSSVKVIELTAEKAQQVVLESFVSVLRVQYAPDLEQITNAADNLCRYCRSEAINIVGDLADQLATILSGAFPSATMESAFHVLVYMNRPSKS